MMKNIVRILILTMCISCDAKEEVLFEFKNLDDVLYMAESTNVTKVPEDKLSNFLLSYEETDFVVNDTTSESYGKLRYREDDEVILKHFGEIYSNDTFSVHIVLREKENRNYKFFLRTVSKWNLVIDSYEIASWVSNTNRHCYGSINDKLEVKLFCDGDMETGYVDDQGYFRNSKEEIISTNKALDYYDYLSNDLNLTPIHNAKHELIRIVYYSSFQFGKVIEFINRDSEYIVKQICHTAIEDSEPCKDFEVSMSSKEWKDLKDILREFDFYTEEQVRNNIDVLDGFIYVLEGRIKDDTSKELEYRFLFRGSPFYDKIGSLCENLIELAGNK